jgi:long-chain acyl-CoA synthetase
LPKMLAETARKLPRRTALIYSDARISYAQLSEQVNRCAAGLQALGLKPGDRVALMMPNCPQFVIAYFGALRAGAIVTATSSMYTPREAAHQWHDAGVSILIVDRKLYPTARAACVEVPEVRHVVLTGLREYQPKGFAALEQALRSKVVGQASRLPSRASRPRGFHQGRDALLTGGTPAPLPEPASARSPLSWRELLCLAREPRPVPQKPADIACLQYTGGTTGTSKGAMLTHANLVTNAHQTKEWLSGDRDAEMLVAALPLFHIYAMTCVMIWAVMAGSTVVILPRFELRAALNVIRKYHPTVFHGVPTMYVAFSNAPRVGRYGFNSLRVCMSGGAPLPLEVQQNFERLSGGHLVEGYGLTEASPVTHVNPPDGLLKTGSIGLPIPGTEARIVELENGARELPVGETGELVIRGPQVMKGYWNRPDETAKVLRNGWLYTGDIARKDEDGYFYIVDRKKDLIIAGGFNIYPREVEEVLFEHPEIKEAVVVGIPDDYRGETVKAFVVLKDRSTATAEDITAWCRERLAPYKVPRQIEFRDSLPKSGVGKYLRRELRSLPKPALQTA